MYNFATKQAMVKNAGFNVKNKADACMLAEEITANDVTEAIGGESFRISFIRRLLIEVV
jgi:ABC-type iron transport system FetAB ATPase subunit